MMRLAYRSRNNRVQTQKRALATQLPKFTTNIGPAKQATLPNGVRVVSEPTIGGSGASSVQLWIKAGSIYETKETNGVASLLQNVAVQAKANELKKYGVKLTGGVCREYTVFKADCLPENVDAVVSVLGQIASGVSATEEVVQKEAQRLAQAASGNVDLWNESTLTDHLFAAAYQGTPYALAPSGEAKTIKSLNQGSLSAFASSRYTGNNIVLSVAGAEPKNVESAFGSVSAGPVPSYSTSRIDVMGSQMNIRDDTVPNAQVLLAYETTGLNGKEWAPLKILQALLGSWEKTSGLGNNSSTRLSETIASEKLAERFSTFNYQSPNTGLFGVYVDSLNEDHLDDVVYEVFNEYQKLYQFLYANDLARAKTQVSANYLSSISTPAGQAYDNGLQLSSVGRRLPPAEYLARIQAVTIDDVKNLLDTYFTDVDPIVVAHGPLEEMPDYGILRGWTYWNRR